MGKAGETLKWSCCLAVAAAGAVAASVASAPSRTGGDMWDSALFFPSLLALAGACAAAGYRVPSMWPLFGLTAIAPFFANQIYFGVRAWTSQGDGLWIVGLLFLVPLAAIPMAGGLVGASWRRKKSAPVS